MSGYTKALGLMLAIVLSGCVSTEALYAEYDEVCPVQARVTDTGMVMVTGIAATGNGLTVAGETESQEWEPAVYFGFDMDDLKASEKARLESNVAVLKRYDALQISVQAYTDHFGEDPHNHVLSKKRMHSVVDFLVDAGISATRIKSSYLGEGAPLLPGHSKEVRTINRRVELMPLDAQGRPLVLRVDFERSGGDSFQAPEPVR